MTILGRGDLSPPRRHHRSRSRVVTTVLVVVVLAVAGYFGWRTVRGSGSKKIAAPPVCVTPTPSPSPAAPAQFVLGVLNSTPRQGMAHQVAAALKARGFRIGAVGNTTPIVSGSAVVDYGAGLATAAVAVAEQVPGATTAQVPRPGITLVLGSGFRGLATLSAVATARTHDVGAASPRPPVCRTP